MVGAGLLGRGYFSSPGGTCVYTRACDQGSVWDWNLGETEAQSAWSLIWDKGLSWIVAQSGIEA